MHLQSTIAHECACDCLCLDEALPILTVARRGRQGYAVHEWSQYGQCYEPLPVWHETQAAAIREREQLLGVREAA
jgi:hypothetical protein